MSNLVDRFKDNFEDYPKWKDLPEETKAIYHGKVENLIDIMKNLSPTRVTVLTGSNGGGKSMIRQQYGSKYFKETGRKCKSVSMQLRTSTNSEWGAFSSAMLDNDTTPTSYNTFRLINGVFKAAGIYKEREPGTIEALSETGYIIIDEPEIGMAEETVLALSYWLREIIPALKKAKIGLMIITHSKLLCNDLLLYDEIDFINLDGKSFEEFVDQSIRVIPTDLKLLHANYLWDAINVRMNKVEAEKKYLNIKENDE